MQDYPDRIDSKFRYVLLASHRAEQLMKGATPKEEGPPIKPTTLGMSEIRDDLVEWDYGLPPEPEPVEDDEALEAAEGDTDAES